MSSAVTGRAPAKVNLFLHVGPVDAAGFHPLCSLVAFADVGDRLTFAPGGSGFEVSGPFAEGVPTGPDNLVRRALEGLARDTGRELAGGWGLEKILPVAAGLGGGSADAGAALRLAADHLGLAPTDPALQRAARSIGADGPMCLASVSAWSEGYGEVLTPEPRLPPLPCVLVNPGVASPTGPVYRAYDLSPRPEADRPLPPQDWSVPGVIGWLKQQRNDLETPAVQLNPMIGQALATVAATPGIALARMSGSGATVFGLCHSPAEAEQAAAHLAALEPGWWVAATTLGAKARNGEPLR